MLNSLLAFFFWNACNFSILKDFSVENLLPALFSRNFLLRSIYHELLIIGVVFLHYTKREERSVWFLFYPYFFLSFFLLFFIFYWYFLWQTLKIHRISSPQFLPLLFNQSICTYQTDSWWDLFSLEICISFAFSLM